MSEEETGWCVKAFPQSDFCKKGSQKATGAPPEPFTSLVSQDGAAAVLDVVLQDVQRRQMSGLQLLDQFRSTQTLFCGSLV